MRFRALLLSLVTTTGLAHAQAGPSSSGGAQPPAPASSSVENDLLTWSGPVQQTSLPELLQVAVRVAPALLSAKLDVAIAEAQIQETWVRRDWVIDAQASGSYSGSGLVSGLTIGSSQRFSGTAGVSRMIPTNGTVGLHVGTSYSKTDAMGFNSKYWSDGITLSITQPLLRNFGGFMYDSKEQHARYSRDVAVLARRLAAIQTVQNIISAYWDLVLAQRQIAITEQSLTLARERLRITELGANGGKIAKAEIPAVQQIIATREEDVLNGQLAVLDRSIALRRAVGMQIGGGQLGLRVATELEARDQPYALGPLLERAYAASPELAELAGREAGATIDIQVNDNGLLPQLDLALQLGPTGTDDTFAHAGSALVKFNEFYAQGTLTFSEGVHRDDVKGRSRELRAGRDKLRVNAIDLRAQIAQTMTRAVAQIELAKRRVVLSQRAIELAMENIRIETDRFNLGKSTNFDVLNRLEEQRQAELRKAQALIDWHKAEAAVQALTGDILPAFGITVD